ncbi:O-antigen ligase family protein [Achromobacter aloeverae]
MFRRSPAKTTRFSTLPLLCGMLFTSLAMNNDIFFIGAGGFKLSPFDFMFVGMLLFKTFRMADPAAYTLPPPRVTLLLFINLLAVVYLFFVSGRQPGIDPSDVARDLRIVLYFVVTPYLCYKDIDSADAYRKLQWWLVVTGLAVSTIMLGQQAVGFSTAEPVRDVSLGIWVLPLSIVSLLYFREQLGWKPRTAYLMTLYMLMALVFSLNRSQYLQLGASVGIAVLLGGRVGAFRNAFKIFMPAFLAGILLFASIGYLDVLESRVLTVEALDEDSSYGARVQEYEGQMDLFRESPWFGHGAGFRSWVMGENGFELSTFAHNSWAFYLMKFGIIGSVVIMAPCLLLMLMTLCRRYHDPQLELHRRYLIATAPIYIFIDSLSGGLAYAPKTAFTGVLLTYCLSLLRNDVRAPAAAPQPSTPVVVYPIRPPVSVPPMRAAWPARSDPRSIAPARPASPTLPRLPHHG